MMVLGKLLASNLYEDVLHCANTIGEGLGCYRIL